MPPELTDLRLYSTTWVRERVTYTRDAIAGIFGLPPSAQEEADKIMGDLVYKGILKKCSKTGEQQSGVEQNNPLELFIGKGDYAFSYVGIYCYKGHLVYALPKYEQQHELHTPEPLQGSTTDTARLEALAQLMQVIHRYESQNTENLDNLQQENENEHYLAQLVSLVTDYVENGEYRDDEQRDALNENGRILWDRTINSIQPHIQKGRPVYTDMYTRRLVDAEDHFISKLHRVIVKECERQLEIFGLLELLELPVVETIEDDVEELGETEYLIHCIDNELGCQFDSRRVHVLKSMKAYLENRRQRDDEAQEEYYFGSSSFHTVWEEACREVFGKDERKDHQIAPPTWKFMANKALQGPADSLEPDIIIKRPDAYWLFDAKYYLPRISGNSVSGLPGVSDVTKQFLYQQALQKQEGAAIPPIHNAFLIPLPSNSSEQVQAPASPITLFAQVSMPLFSTLPDINTFFIHPQSLYNAYLHPEQRAMLQNEMVACINATPSACQAN